MSDKPVIDFYFDKAQNLNIKKLAYIVDPNIQLSDSAKQVLIEYMEEVLMRLFYQVKINKTPAECTQQYNSQL